MTYKFKGRGLVQLTGRQLGKSTTAQAYWQYMQAIANARGKGTYQLIVERSEGRVFGARYWTVHPVLEPSWVYDTHRQWDSMLAWVVETFGPTAKDGVFTPGQRWYVNNAKFWFRDEADLLVFLLRWQ